MAGFITSCYKHPIRLLKMARLHIEVNVLEFPSCVYVTLNATDVKRFQDIKITPWNAQTQVKNTNNQG
jgi:hypothetical protein